MRDMDNNNIGNPYLHVLPFSTESICGDHLYACEYYVRGVINNCAAIGGGGEGKG